MSFSPSADYLIPVEFSLTNSAWPWFCGNGSCINTDNRRKIVLALARERAKQRVLDLGNQRQATEHQAGINLDQARAGADFCERVLAAFRAAGADNRKHAFDPHKGFREHP